MAERASAGEPTTATVSNERSLLASATEDELIVAQILLNLRYMLDLVECAPGPKWRRKRRRSCLSKAASSAPASSLKRTNVEKKPQVKVAEQTAAAAAAIDTASPVTPHAFPTSESDEKPRRAIKKSFKKRSTQEYIAMIDELTERGDLLRKEIETVTKYLNQLNDFNSQLKAARQEVLSSCPMKEPEKEGIVRMNLGAELITHNHRIGVAPHLADRTAQNTRASVGPISAQFNGLSTAHHVGSNGIPDLNVSADVVIGDTYQPLDLSRELTDRRARSAEARMRRKGIMKRKPVRSSCGVRTR